MNVLDFGIEVIALSASGVLAPGPLFFANLAYATRLDRWSGVKVAHGHTVVELPLIIMLAAGLFTFDVAKKYSWHHRIRWRNSDPWLCKPANSHYC